MLAFVIDMHLFSSIVVSTDTFSLTMPSFSSNEAMYSLNLEFNSSRMS